MAIPALRNERSLQGGVLARTDDKERRILDAALALFAERGFHGTAVPQIAERAEVGTGTLYRYFAGKDVLVNALYRDWKQRLLSSIADGFPFDAPIREQFHVLWTRWLAFAAAHPQAARFLELHHHDDYLDAESLALRTSVFGAVSALLANARAQRAVRGIPDAVLVSVVEGQVLGLLKGAAEGRLVLDAPTVAQAETCAWESIRA